MYILQLMYKLTKMHECTKLFFTLRFIYRFQRQSIMFRYFQPGRKRN